MHGTPPTKELQSKLEILNGEMTSIYDSNYDFSFPFLATEPWMFVISSNSSPDFEVLVGNQEMHINIHTTLMKIITKWKKKVLP